MGLQVLVGLAQGAARLVGVGVARWSRWLQGSRVGRLVMWALLGTLVVGVLAGVVMARWTVGWWTFAEMGATLAVLVALMAGLWWDVEDWDDE